ncbi:MAG: ATP-binding protein, partial [Deltaproteobacteria bacterium]|nr:ATP-binding protein [Deltaproteobacteria bacterium]
LGVHDKRLGLQMSEAAIDAAVKRTEELVPGPTGGTHYSGDHLQALCRQLARMRLRDGKHDAVTVPADIDKAIEQYIEMPKLTKHEELVVATHEAGHAVTSLAMKNLSPIERISIRGDIGGALGYVKHSDPAHRYVVTYSQLRDTICTMYGGREAEMLMFGDVSTGSASDLENASQIARALVERYGDGGTELGVAMWAHDRNQPVSERARALVDQQIKLILDTERERCREILARQKTLLVAMRDLLVEKKVLDRSSFSHLTEAKSDPALNTPGTDLKMGETNG